ncbi:MAG: class I SAM-dependent methyltransferase [bacterium]
MQQERNKKEVENYYDNYTSRQLRAGINKRHKSILNLLKENGLKKNHCVLEVGCGIGTVSGLIAKYLSKGKLTSIDLSPKSIEIAKKRLNSFKNINFIACDITIMNIEGQFDFIVLPDVLEHIPIEQHNKLFSKLNSVLKPEGAIYIHIPDPLYLDGVRLNRPEDLQIIDQSLNVEHIVSLAKENGFYITYLGSYSIWTKPIEYQHILMKKKEYVSSIKAITYKPGFWKKAKYKLKLLLKK